MKKENDINFDVKKYYFKFSKSRLGEYNKLFVKEALNQLVKESGCTKKEFAKKYDIPYRTFLDWSLGNKQNANLNLWKV